MHIQLPHRNEVRLLPKSLQDHLKNRFHLSPEYVKVLRCFIYEGTVGTKTVRRVSIFSPEDAVNKKIMVRTLKDLETNPSMILFEGYVDKQGNPYAADRRAPKKANKKKLTENK